MVKNFFLNNRLFEKFYNDQIEKKVGRRLPAKRQPPRGANLELNTPGSGLPLRRDVSRRWPGKEENGDERHRANPASREQVADGQLDHADPARGL